MKLPGRTPLYAVVALSLIVLFPTRTAAWGSKGHQIIARIATDRLSSNARASVAELLEKGDTLESVSMWADQIKSEPGREKTANWHLVLIGVNEKYYDRSRDCPKGNVCIIEAIEQQRLLLKNLNQLRAKRAEALKFLVHLVGDVHQPFHVTTNLNPADAGATRLKVTFLNGRPTNLHAVWDDDIINYTLKQSRQSVAEYAHQLSLRAGRGSGTYSPKDEENWAEEAHKVAGGAYLYSPNSPNSWHTFMYPKAGKVWNLDSNYYNKNRVVMEKQMMEAGVHLAAVLNYIFA